MIKKIPGNSELRIDMDGRIYNGHGDIVNLPTVNGDVKIDLFGTERWVGLKWLSLLAWYECGHITDLSKHLDKIKFVAVDNTYLRIRCKKLMVFTEPVYYRKGFRYIPNHPKYAIDIDGIVLDTSTNEILNDVKLDNHGYPTHYLRSPDRNMNRTVKLHRLLCMAWLPNDDYINRPLINHINGIKDDSRLDNLEWCSTTENVRHALDTGLNDCGIQVKVRDVKTGLIEVYSSMNAAIRALGLGKGYSMGSVRVKLPGYLWKKRYEIKAVSDTSPWYYESVDVNDFKLGKSYYTFTVHDKRTGVERKFNTRDKLCKAYGIPYSSTNVSDFVLKLKEDFDYLSVKYKRNAVSGPYYVHDRKTRVLAVFTSLDQVSKHTGRTKSEIQVDLSRGMKYIYDKRWLVLTNTSKDNGVEPIDKPKPYKKVLIVNVETGESQKADSIRHAVRITGLNNKTIASNLNTEKQVKGFIFRALDR